MGSPLEGLSTLKNFQVRRCSSWDQTGGNFDAERVEPGATHVLADIQGAGIIKHIWITIACDDPMFRRNLVLRMFWDGEEHPSVEAPIGDFFGQGWGEKYNWFSLPLAAAPMGGNALVSYFPMPFGDGARIEVVNQSDFPIGALYFYVDCEEHDSIPDTEGRFHAFWNRELTAPEGERENEWCLFGPEAKNLTDANNYLFVEAEGRGHFVGVNYFVECPTPIWYGEGDDMFVIDGEPWPPRLHGTGTEDYFNTSWCPKEIYQHPYFGIARINENIGWLGRTHCYRFHIEDPIPFTKSLRASIEHGHANMLAVDLCSVAYWYQAEPHRPLPALRPREQRQNMPEIRLHEIHAWRDAWRKAMGGGALWGHETPEK
jgi:D-arabinan exo alpha-(1,3)/(1,5)-arabinofuranosidase (non-reducing end)